MGANTPLEVPIKSGRYTVAIVCANDMQIVSAAAYEMTLAELPTLDYDGSCAFLSVVSVSGRVNPINDDHDVAFGGRETGAVRWLGGTYSLNVTPGTHDLVVGRGALVRDRMVIVRDLAVIGPTIQAGDVDGPGGFAMEFPAVSWPGDTYSHLRTEGGTTIELGLIGPGRIVAPPESQLRPGDLLRTAIFSNANIGSSPKSATSSIHTSHARRSSFALPPALQPMPIPTASRAGQFAFVQVAWQAQPIAVVYELFVGGLWAIYISPSVFERTGIASMVDVSLIPGFETYGVALSQTNPWALSAVSGGAIEDLIRPFPAREAQVEYSGWTGAVPVTSIGAPDL